MKRTYIPIYIYNKTGIYSQPYFDAGIENVCIISAYITRIDLVNDIQNNTWSGTASGYISFFVQRLSA